MASIDPEVEALAKMAALIEPFDSKARQRMLTWLTSWALRPRPDSGDGETGGQGSR